MLSPHSPSVTHFLSLMLNCTTLNDPNQGTSFRELVILPMLAPELACLYHVPGTPEYIAAQAALHAAASGIGQGLEIDILHID